VGTLFGNGCTLLRVRPLAGAEGAKANNIQIRIGILSTGSSQDHARKAARNNQSQRALDREQRFALSRNETCMRFSLLTFSETQTQGITSFFAKKGACAFTVSEHYRHSAVRRH
jgi:hypothetical protein